MIIFNSTETSEKKSFVNDKIEKCEWTERGSETDRQTDRQIYRETERQRDGETERQSDRVTERQRDRERETATVKDKVLKDKAKRYIERQRKRETVKKKRDKLKKLFCFFKLYATRKCLVLFF